MATGAGRQLAAQHSHSLEGWYAHIPGLRVARPGDAGGRARDALAGAAGPRPGADLRARRALQRSSGELADDAGPGGHRPRRGPAARRRRDAGHLRRHRCPRRWRRPTQLAAEGIDAEVVDLRVLRPLDDATTCWLGARGPTARSSSTRAGAAGSLSAEISARITEQAFYELDAPGAPGLQRRGADALRPAPGGGRAAAGGRHRRRRAGWRCGSWLSSGCRRSAPTWTTGTLLEWLVEPGRRRAPAATSSRSSTPTSRRSRWRASRTGWSSSCSSSPGPRCRSAPRSRCSAIPVPLCRLRQPSRSRPTSPPTSRLPPPRLLRRGPRPRWRGTARRSWGSTWPRSRAPAPTAR